MKTIPALLLTHKAQPATTLTKLMKVGPLPDGSYRGFTELDADVAYNDALGSITYRSHTGMDMSALMSSADLGVDNAEVQTLYPVMGYEIEGFTQAEIDAGVLDKTPFIVYQVNYRDLTMGHEIVSSGTIGEQRTKHGQMTILELRSLSQQLKQNVGELDSLTCRAKFGSQIGEERFPCGYSLTAEWVNATVTSVAAGDAEREFTALSLAQATSYFVPGVVEWLTGNNVGQQREVEGFGSGIVSLQFPTVRPIVIGDTLRIRRDCVKRWTGANSCNTFWGVNKPLHFRGEPHIPIGDTGNLNSPGVAISAGGSSGSGESSK